MTQDRPVYIYGLADGDGVIRYVGKTVIPKERARAHKRQRFPWMAEFLVLETVTTNWVERERWWIAHGKQEGWPLENRSDGGDGTRGISLRESHRQSIGQQMRGNVNGFATEHSAEFRKRHRELMLGRRQTPEFIAKLDAGRTRRRDRREGFTAGLSKSLLAAFNYARRSQPAVDACTYCIAEAGSSHDGSLQLAVGLIRSTRRAGASAVKFQFWSDPERLASRRNATEYVQNYREHCLPVAWLPRLSRAARTAGLDFICTAYLPEDIPVIAPYVDRFKIASFESSDRAFIEAHVPFGLPLIISTGMMNSTEVASLDEWLNVAVRPVVQADLLHCVSAYPAPSDQLNLGAIRSGIFAGFSDHSDPRFLLSGSFAVAAGARMLEAHLRDFETSPQNPDYPHSMNPHQFRIYVALIRLCERALGSGKKRQQPCEAKMAQYRVGASQ